MYCKKCNQKINEDSKFCIFCGKKYILENNEDISNNNNECESNNQNIKKWLKTLFKGRLNRINFFLGNISTLVILLFTILINKLVFNGKIPVWGNIDFYTFYWIIFLIILYSFLILINISMSIRRFHDLGYSGFIILISLIPIIGIFPIILSFIEIGDQKNNKYGEVPNKKIKYLYTILAIFPTQIEIKINNNNAKKLIWWGKGLYFTGLMICLLIGGLEQAGYLFNEPLSIIGHFLFYIPLISVIGFSWRKLSKNE